MLISLPPTLLLPVSTMFLLSLVGTFHGIQRIDHHLVLLLLLLLFISRSHIVILVDSINVTVVVVVVVVVVVAIAIVTHNSIRCDGHIDSCPILNPGQIAVTSVFLDF